MLSGMRPDRDLVLIYAAAFLRSLGVGMTGVVLGIYLFHAGFSATFIGVVIAAGMGGAALATTVTSLGADRLGRRRTLVGLSLLVAAGGVGFSLAKSAPGILLFALFGMINGTGTDRGPAFALDQAVIPQLTSNQNRTLALSWYGLVLDWGHAIGALGAGLPMLLQHLLRVDLVFSFRLTFLVYAGLNLLTSVLYLVLSPPVEVVRGEVNGPAGRVTVSPQTRRIVIKLAALSGIDSLGGGFLSDALIAYWFFRRFGVPETSLGVLFAVGNLLNSVSYLFAAWLARRIGLLNTMVFTHIPSSLFLIAVPFAQSFGWAIVFLLAREALVEMDVPTRQSYIVGVVHSNERTFASGITNVTRNVARAMSPSLAGYLMQHLALAIPMFLGGGIKIGYDLLLYRAFRRLKPPEEQRSPATAT